MMTVTEITPSEGTSQTLKLEPEKARHARRKRHEILKLKSTCSREPRNGVVYYPSTERVTCVSHGVMSIMGRRREMEDSATAELGFVEIADSNNKCDFFGVYDGHGGSHVAEACRDRLHWILSEEVRKDTWRGVVDWEMVMTRCFERMDMEVGGGDGGGKKEVAEMTVGSTAVTAVVGVEEVVVANCGDSRAVICRNGAAVPLSFDHKPDRPDELARIEAAGGRVINWYGHRVLGVLATSRSIGDHHLKPYVSCTPEVTVSKRTEADEFLILASDGLWDVISNQVACQVVRRCLTGRFQRKNQEGTTTSSSSSRAQVAAALLTELALAKGSKDNITVIVVELTRKFSRFICS